MRTNALKRVVAVGAAFLVLSGPVIGQVDTTSTYEEEEIDFSLYDNLSFADAGAKRFCSPKIEGLSPAKLISFGYDFQGGYDLNAGEILAADGSTLAAAGDARVNATTGLRAGFNVPVISKTSVVWQLGANVWNTRYAYAETPAADANPLHRTLSEHGLRTAGVNTTVFKPLDSEKFILFQGSADLSGTYGSSLMPLKYLKYSAALLYGKRPTERKQWAVGVARTYRVGEINYIPVVLYNATDARNKWGTEILFPARAHVRRTLNPRNMLFFGYELEGQSYRLWRNLEGDETDLSAEDLEIRRGEARVRFVYECSLKSFVWLSVQAGYRVNYRYDVDRLVEGEEIYRAFGLLRDDPYAQVNGMGNPFYLNVSLNLVSP